MDEADKLCDRIAIVDHGELKALDSPLKLKASIPGKNSLEVSFANAPAGLAASALRAAAGRRSGRPAHENVFRIATGNGPATTLALMEPRRRAGVTVGVAVGAEHDARRCVRALHRPGAARRAAGRRRPQDSPFMIAAGR